MNIPQHDIESITKRIARAQGQLGGVTRMLEEGRECIEVLTQLSAAQAAISRAAFALIASGMANCTKDEAGQADLAKLEKAFLSLA